LQFYKGDIKETEISFGNICILHEIIIQWICCTLGWRGKYRCPRDSRCDWSKVYRAYRIFCKGCSLCWTLHLL